MHNSVVCMQLLLILNLWFNFSFLTLLIFLYTCELFLFDFKEIIAYTLLKGGKTKTKNTKTSCCQWCRRWVRNADLNLQKLVRTKRHGSFYILVCEGWCWCWCVAWRWKERISPKILHGMIYRFLFSVLQFWH